LWLQQSHCDVLVWLLGQQLAFGVQHAEPGLQHAAPVAASALRENREMATMARTFAFMTGILSV
jgi:hypothetical protein